MVGFVMCHVCKESLCGGGAMTDALEVGYELYLSFCAGMCRIAHDVLSVATCGFVL